MRRVGFTLAAIFLGAIVTAGLAEGAARFYVYFVVQHGKLFQPDADLGWALIPNLDLERKNSDGEEWHVRTNERSFRSLADDFPAEEGRRVLVLGDSFAFGEGVQLEDRFDSRLAETHPDWTIINQGVMGYGTDQQLIAARGDIAKLRDGDVLLIVSYLNDFVDLLRRSHSGRAKPWFEIVNGELIPHPPDIGFSESVRDQSYLLARLFHALSEGSPSFTPGEVDASGHLYRRLIQQETAEAIGRGVRVLVGHHGSPSFGDGRNQRLKGAAEKALGRLCEDPGISCVSLDRALLASRASSPFQNDGHWNATGNQVVAVALDRALTRILEEPADGPGARRDRVISHGALQTLRSQLPRELWRFRDVFFDPEMQLRTTERTDQSPPPAYVSATRTYRNAKIGPDGSLEGYVAGQPFPMEHLDCARDPQAGVKIAWNFDHQWEGAGSHARFRITFVRKGRVQDGSLEGRTSTVFLSNRVEPHYLRGALQSAPQGALDGELGSIFPGDPRKLVNRIDLTAPPGARGNWTGFTRYRSSEGPPAAARLDGVWQLVPSVGRATRSEVPHRGTPIPGTEIVPDDLASFAGVVPRYEWECLGETELIAPVDSDIRGYPYQSDYDFGASGLSFANDRWQLRPVVKIRMRPKDAEHPYSKKDLYLDRETLRALYSFAYDRTDALWKVIVHNGRFSESDPDYYPGWEGIPSPRDAKTVADVILNVQTGLGTRIEYWDNHGTPIGGRSEIKTYLERTMREQGI